MNTTTKTPDRIALSKVKKGERVKSSLSENSITWIKGDYDRRIEAYKLTNADDESHVSYMQGRFSYYVMP